MSELTTMQTVKTLKFTVVEFDSGSAFWSRRIQGDYVRCEHCRRVIAIWNHDSKHANAPAWKENFNRMLNRHMEDSPGCVWLKPVPLQIRLPTGH